jgi:hypothetical protein
MKTFKVTFFDKFDILTVITFHNISDQEAFINDLAVQIVTTEIAPVVRCESNGEDYTEAVNHFLKSAIDQIEKGYAINYFRKMDAIA